jgi:hypothetical protein
MRDEDDVGVDTLGFLLTHLNLELGRDLILAIFHDGLLFTPKRPGMGRPARRDDPASELLHDMRKAA